MRKQNSKKVKGITEETVERGLKPRSAKVTVFFPTDQSVLVNPEIILLFPSPRVVGDEVKWFGKAKKCLMREDLISFLDIFAGCLALC